MLWILGGGCCDALRCCLSVFFGALFVVVIQAMFLVALVGGFA